MENMKTFSNQTFFNSGISTKPALSVFNRNSDEKQIINAAMSTHEIADIFSEKLIKIIQSQFEEVRLDFNSRLDTSSNTDNQSNQSE